MKERIAGSIVPQNTGMSRFFRDILIVEGIAIIFSRTNDSIIRDIPISICFVIVLLFIISFFLYLRNFLTHTAVFFVYYF